VQQFKTAAQYPPLFLLINQWNEFAGQPNGSPSYAGTMGIGEKKEKREKEKKRREKQTKGKQGKKTQGKRKKGEWGSFCTQTKWRRGTKYKKKERKKRKRKKKNKKNKRLRRYEHVFFTYVPSIYKYIGTVRSCGYGIRKSCPTVVPEGVVSQQY
jgi:hypothetical protein